MRKDSDPNSSHREPLAPTSPSRRRPLPPARSDWPFGSRRSSDRGGEVFRPDPVLLRERRAAPSDNLPNLI